MAKCKCGCDSPDRVDDRFPTYTPCSRHDWVSPAIYSQWDGRLVHLMQLKANPMTTLDYNRTVR